MGKNVVTINYRRFAPVGQDPKCANCPSACKTSCMRQSLQKDSNGGSIDDLNRPRSLDESQKSG